MKKYTFLFLFLALSSVAMATPSPACPSGNCTTTGTALPIDNNICYLLMAGIVIGILAVRKYKSLEATV